MMWGRLDDHAWQNEKLIGLSNAAHCLYWIAISFVASEWPQGMGRLSPERARALARMHSICEPDDDSIDVVVAELVAKRCWIRQPRMYAIHDIKRYMPPADLSEKRAAAGRKGRKARSTNETALAIATANDEHLPQQTPSKGSPEPEPVPEKETKAKKATLSLVVVPPLASSNGNGTKHRPPGKVKPTPEMLAAFTETWNAACAPLPRLLKPPESADGQRLVMQAWRAADGGVGLLDRAMRLFALDPYHREKGYGYATFCRHADHWVGKAATPLPVASAASSWDS